MSAQTPPSATGGDVIIARRFRGPPESANGGYACGVMAKRVSGSARVRLLRPPPLDRTLSITAVDGRLVMSDRDVVVAEGAASMSPEDVQPAVAYEDAVSASADYRWSTGHPFAGCFVCGPEREPGDGLCIFPGPVPGRAVVAAPWIPHASVSDDGGHALPEVVWAALDCPSWFGLLEFEPGVSAGLLGQLTASVFRRPAVGERCVAVGWSRGRDGRKLHAGAALYSSTGELLGHSDAIWIEPK